MEAKLIVTAAFATLVIQGCSRERSDTHAQRAAEWEAPTAWASGPPPHPDVQNGAPLNNAAGYPQRARISSPDERHHEGQAGSERSASGQFVAAPGRRLRGEAELQEIADSVRVRVEVEQGQPGTRRVVFSKNTDCATFEKTIAAAPDQLPGSGLGAITIDASGHGEAVLSVPKTNLRPNADYSLAGGALLLYAPERVAAATARREVPVACAPIASQKS